MPLNSMLRRIPCSDCRPSRWVSNGFGSPRSIDILGERQCYNRRLQCKDRQCSKSIPHEYYARRFMRSAISTVTARRFYKRRHEYVIRQQRWAKRSFVLVHAGTITAQNILCSWPLRSTSWSFETNGSLRPGAETAAPQIVNKHEPEFAVSYPVCQDTTVRLYGVHIMSQIFCENTVSLFIRTTTTHLHCAAPAAVIWDLT